MYIDDESKTKQLKQTEQKMQSLIIRNYAHVISLNVEDIQQYIATELNIDCDDLADTLNIDCDQVINVLNTQICHDGEDLYVVFEIAQ